jgi:glycosyltransferase involved in cell wall biosynthesis
VDLSFFSRDKSVGKLRNTLGLPEDKVLAMFVGRFVTIKNVAMLLRAFIRIATECPELNLVLVGDGPDRTDLQRDALRFGVGERVHFLGTLSGEHLRSCYATADIFLLPSRYDNFPNVVLEAMAMELPVVATRVGGVPSQVEHGVTGFLVPPDDDETMAKRILDLYCSEELRTFLGREGLNRIRGRYDWRRTAKLFVDWAESR